MHTGISWQLTEQIPQYICFCSLTLLTVLFEGSHFQRRNLKSNPLLLFSEQFSIPNSKITKVFLLKRQFDDIKTVAMHYSKHW